MSAKKEEVKQCYFHHSLSYPATHIIRIACPKCNTHRVEYVCKDCHHSIKGYEGKDLSTQCEFCKANIAIKDKWKILGEA